MLPVLNIGPLALPVPAFLLLIGFWLGLELTEKHALRFGVDPGQIFQMAVAAVVAGLAGARLAYAAYSPAAFLANPLSLLSPQPQMLDGTAGVIVGLLAGFAYGWFRKLDLWPTLDAVTTLFSVMSITLGLAHFASGDAFGAPTRVAWAITLWGEERHPTQVYETLAALAIASAVWPGSRAARHTLARPGFRFWLFLAASAAARLVLETFRGDSTLLLNAFRETQVIAWPVLAVSLWQMGKRIAGRPVELDEETV